MLNFKINKLYRQGNIDVRALYYDNKKGALVVKTEDVGDNMLMVCMDIAGVKNGSIVCGSVVGYGVSFTEMSEQVREEVESVKRGVAVDTRTMANKIRNRYIKIPQYIAEIFADMYINRAKNESDR